MLITFACIVRQLKCCGVKAPSDWTKSNWYHTTGQKAKESYPESCCKKKVDKCSGGKSPDIYQDVSITRDQFRCSKFVFGSKDKGNKWINVVLTVWSELLQGCSQALQSFVKGKMAVIGGIGVGIAILQVDWNINCPHWTPYIFLMSVRRKQTTVAAWLPARVKQSWWRNAKSDLGSTSLQIG